MKIRIATLTNEGFKIEDSIMKEELNNLINSNPNHLSDIVFTTDAKVSLIVKKILLGAEVKGVATINYEQNCARCDLKIARTENLQISAHIKQITNGERFSDLDELGVIYYEGEYADLRPYVEETIILALNLFWSPKVDKTGKCLECKKPCWEVETKESHDTKKKLFEAFRKAGVN